MFQQMVGGTVNGGVKRNDELTTVTLIVYDNLKATLEIV